MKNVNRYVPLFMRISFPIGILFSFLKVINNQSLFKVTIRGRIIKRNKKTYIHKGYLIGTVLYTEDTYIRGTHTALIRHYKVR